MPDTDTLEVKEVKEVKMIETETESKIEASVGENDVVALVDEAEHLNSSDTSEEMDTNAGSEPQLEAVVEEMAGGELSSCSGARGRGLFVLMGSSVWWIRLRRSCL